MKIAMRMLVLTLVLGAWICEQISLSGPGTRADAAQFTSF